MASVLAVTKSQNVRILKVLLQGPTTKLDVHHALLYACREGLAECVQCLLTKCDPDLKSYSGDCALHLAVDQGHAGVVEILCQAGACVNARGSGTSAPVHIASKWGKDECLQVLIKHGCDVNIRDSTRSTAFMLAVKNKQYSAIRMLLDAGCCVNAVDISGTTALHFASLTGTAVDQILLAGADVNICNADGCSPLLYAATEGLDRVVTRLTQVPTIDVNLSNQPAGKTPLHILSYKGHADSVRDVMGCGANPNIRDAWSKTALWYAVDNGHLRVVKVLLMSIWDSSSYKCPTNDTSDTCPVQLALDNGLPEMMKLFIMTCYDNHHVRECLQRPEADDLFSGTNDTGWVFQGQKIPTLQQTCRKWIRHYMRATTLTSNNSIHLPIPKKLIDYILMKELEEWFV